MAVMLILTGAGCAKQVGNNSTGTTTSSQKEYITIGGIIPLTGVAAEYGANENKAINLAVEKINKAGGVLGKDLKVVLEDSKCDAKEGATAVTKLINVNKVDVLASFECSGPTFSGAPVANANNKLFLAAVATAPGLGEMGDNIFRIAPSDAIQGKDLASAIYNKGYSKTAIMYANNDYGLGIKKVFEANFKGTLVGSEAINTDASEFRTNLIKIKGNNPDSVVLVLLSSKQYTTVLKQMKELGLTQQVFGTETMKDDSLIKEAGSLMEGKFLTYYQTPSTSIRSAWAKEMKEKNGAEPGVFADFAYDVVMAYAQAIQKAGSVDGTAIKTALQGLKYNGVTGEIAFDKDGEVTGGSFSLFTVKNGKFEEVK